MEGQPTNTLYHTNKYNADSACDHCQGVTRHEEWCGRANAGLVEFDEAIQDPSKLSLLDTLILHALGVRWA